MAIIKPKLITQTVINRAAVLLLLAGIFYCEDNFAQEKDSSTFKIGGYVDAYYARYSDSVGTNNFQQFPVVSPRSNVFGLNIVQLSAQYSSKKLRAVVTLHYGDIPISAWSPVYNLVQEANLGIRISKNIWMDAGFFKTHIGTEAFLPKDNISSSLSIITFYEPWFQSGIKLSWTPTDKLLICLHLLNGYNTFVENNKTKSVGITFNYTLGDKGNIGYYNLLGDETPDSIHRSHLRFLQNAVFTYQLSPHIKILIGGDIISQQRSVITDSLKAAFIYGGIATVKYQIKPKYAVYARAEFFRDENAFLTGVITDVINKPTGFKLTGYTAGMEYKPSENSYIRLEGRQLEMDKDQEIFRWNGKTGLVNHRLEMMLHAGIWF